jgi:hypothetical protein
VDEEVPDAKAKSDDIRETSMQVENVPTGTGN